MAFDPDTTNPKLNLELGEAPEQHEENGDEEPPGDRRHFERRRNPYRSRKVVAVPLGWVVTFLSSVTLGFFWIGFNWASALRELENLTNSVHHLQETASATSSHVWEIDRNVAVMQRQLDDMERRPRDDRYRFR